MTKPKPPSSPGRKPKAKSKSKAPAVDTTVPEPAASTNGSTALASARPTRKPPVRFSEEVAEAILDGLRKGQSLREICEVEGMPDESSVRVALHDTPFAEQYRCAREIGYEKMADEIIEIADAKDGDPQWAKLQVDARKWKLSKCLPKIYGDRLEVEAKAGIVVVKLDDVDLTA